MSEIDGNSPNKSYNPSVTIEEKRSNNEILSKNIFGNQIQINQLKKSGAKGGIRPTQDLGFGEKLAA